MIKLDSFIACIMQTNGMLDLIDKYKNDENITLREIQTEWTSKYILDAREHLFLNQYQYLTSLLAYIIIPKENLFDELPVIDILELPEN